MPKFDDIAVGAELPALTVPVTVTLVAGGGMATRDYFPGHHDLEAARELGSAHIFMNILTTNGLLQRYIDDWSGPEGRMRDLKIKLGAPNYPGDSMALTAAVTDKRDADRTVEVTLKGVNSMGNHVTGTVRVALP